MADNYQTDAGSGGNTYFSDDIGGTHAPLIKIMLGALDSNDGPISEANPMPVDIQEVSGAAVDVGGGAEATALRVTIANDSTGLLSVDDGGSSLTVDNAALSITGGGVEASALRVTIASDSTGLLSVNDGGGSITVDNDDKVSTNNSTTTPLGGAASFTGTGDDCLGYTSVTIQLLANVDSATDGMTFEFSSDNSNWDDVYTFTYTAADGARRFQLPVTARYFRINYTNGAGAQATFRVQTILHRQVVLTTIHRVVDDVDPDRSAILVKAIVAAQAAGSGDFVPVQATAAGNFKMSLEEIDAALLGGGVEAGALLVTIASDSTGVLTVDDGGSSLTVDNPTLAVVGGGVEATALRVTMANDSTGLLPISAASLPLPTGAATAANQLGDGHNVTVDNGSGGSAVNIQDGGNTITVDGTVTANAGTGTFTVGGVAAHDAAVSGNPVLLGFEADNTETSPVTTDGDVVRGWADRFGRQVVTLDHPPDEAGAGTHGPYTENQTAIGDQELLAAPGASTSIYVTGFWMSNQGSAKNRVSLREGAAGTERYKGTLAADGGGIVRNGIKWVLPANVALTGNLGAAGDVDYSIDFFVAPTPA